jgi:hypothetical protein
MAKHKSQLYEILAKQRGREEVPPVSGVKPAPIIRQTPVVAAARPQPAPKAAETPRREVPTGPVLRPAPSKAPVVIGGVGLTYVHLVWIGLVIAGLCVFFYLLGNWIRGNGLPPTVKHPTMDEIKGGPVQPNLIVPGVERPAPRGIVGQQSGGPGPGEKAGGPTPGGIERPGGGKPGPVPGGKKIVPPEKAGGPGVEPLPWPPEKAGGPVKGGAEKGGPEKATVPTGPRYRVRIQTFDIGQPSAVDQLRDFLQKDGIETEDVPGRGVHILFSQEQFADKKKCDELAAKTRKALEAFEKQTRRRTSKDAYSELVKE